LGEDELEDYALSIASATFMNPLSSSLNGAKVEGSRMVHLREKTVMCRRN